MILPTRRAVLAFALVAAVAPFGYADPRVLQVVALADAALVVLIVLDALGAVRPDAIGVTRHGPDTFSVGRESATTYRWHNPAARAARLLVREVRPALLGGTAAPRAVSLGARGALRHTATVRPLRRGQEGGGSFAIRSIGPLGLGMRQGRRDLPWSVRVYPNIPASRLKASIAEAVRHRERGIRAVRHPGEGRQFESLREWVWGDDPRHLDWKATVRRGKLMTRLYEEERRQQLMLVVDAGRLVTEAIDGQPRIEYIVQAALLLALAAVYHDDDVGVMVFADTVSHYAPPARGRRGLRHVLDALAVVEPALVEPDYPAAFRYLAVRSRKRALTVCFTDVIDRFASEALLANVAGLRPRHLPLVVTVRNPELDRLAVDRPGDVSAAYRKAAAEDLLQARREALLEMRRAGALVLDVDPARAADAVVATYLDLKRRGRV